MDVQTFENARWAQKPQKPEFRHRAALSLVSEGPVLDIGCGDGLLLSMLTEKGIAAEGVDFSDVAVAHCAEQGLHAKQVDIVSEPLSYADSTFPTVIALDVLEHVYDPVALLKEIARVSGGRVIIGVPNFSSLPARLQVLFGKVPENNTPSKGHVYWFNWRVLTAMAAQEGLSITLCRTNAPWERVPLLGGCMKGLARMFPNLFALSFVIVCEKSRHD